MCFLCILFGVLFISIVLFFVVDLPVFFSAFLFFPKTNQKYNFRLNRRLNSGLKSENFLHFLRFSNVQQMSQVFSWKIRILQPNCYLFHDGLTFFVFSDLLLILVVFGFVCSFVRASTLTRSMLTTPGSKKQQTIEKHTKKKKNAKTYEYMYTFK